MKTTYTENVFMQGGEDTGILSHLNTSFVPSLRDFDHTFCLKRRCCYSQKEILYGLFSCMSQGSGIWPKNCQKNWMLQLSPYLSAHTKQWYLHNIKTCILIFRFTLLITVFIVLKNGLSNNFARVEVSVVDCPDLREKPFSLAAQGRISFVTT